MTFSAVLICESPHIVVTSPQPRARTNHMARWDDFPERLVGRHPNALE